MRSSMRSAAWARRAAGSGSTMRQWRSGASGDSASECGWVSIASASPKLARGAAPPSRAATAVAQPLVELQPGDQQQQFALEGREPEDAGAMHKRRREARASASASTASSAPLAPAARVPPAAGAGVAMAATSHCRLRSDQPVSSGWARGDAFMAAP